MMVLDVNLRVYVLNADRPQPARALAWWQRVLNGHESIGLPWVTVLGVLRIVTNRRILNAPVSVDEAMMNVEEWLRQPMVAIVEPCADHAHILNVAAGGALIRLPTRFTAPRPTPCLPCLPPGAAQRPRPERASESASSLETRALH